MNVNLICEGQKPSSSSKLEPSLSASWIRLASIPQIPYMDMYLPCTWSKEFYLLFCHLQHPFIVWITSHLNTFPLHPCNVIFYIHWAAYQNSSTIYCVSQIISFEGQVCHLKHVVDFLPSLHGYRNLLWYLAFAFLHHLPPCFGGCKRDWNSNGWKSKGGVTTQNSYIHSDF